VFCFPPNKPPTSSFLQFPSAPFPSAVIFSSLSFSFPPLPLFPLPFFFFLFVQFSMDTNCFRSSKRDHFSFFFNFVTIRMSVPQPNITPGKSSYTSLTPPPLFYSTINSFLLFSFFPFGMNSVVPFFFFFFTSDFLPSSLCFLFLVHFFFLFPVFQEHPSFFFLFLGPPCLFLPMIRLFHLAPFPFLTSFPLLH